MSVTIISESSESLTLQITISLEGSMLKVEETIQEALNAAGQVPVNFTSCRSWRAKEPWYHYRIKNS